MPREITLAITHYNRFGLLRECIPQAVLEDPRISEIVVSDDASTDDSYEKSQFYFHQHEKVKFFRNEQNLDCYRNKAKAVERATNEWVVLFDSDNIFSPRYVDVLFEIPTWEPDTFYCPEFAEPCFNYTQFAGLTVDQHTVSRYMGRETNRPVVQKNGRIIRPPFLEPQYSNFRCALNTANYFFHRDNYLAVWDGKVDPHTSDTIYQALNWLRSGKRISIVKGLRYFHRMHSGSHYIQNKHLTGDFHAKVEQQLIELK